MAAIYSALGLSKNPFAWVDNEDPGPFLDHLNLETPRPGASRLLQLVGVSGAGKSTHLKHWQSLTGGPYFYVEPVHSAAAAIEPPLGPIVYWDEADRFSDRHLRKLFSEAFKIKATVVAGTHRDLSRPAIVSGIEVTTIEFGELDLDVLRLWCDARIGSVRLRHDSGDTLPLAIPDHVLRDVISESGGSLRDAGDALHIWIAKQARILAGQN